MEQLVDAGTALGAGVADGDQVPLAERLWAMRNAAAQMAQSGSRGQARAMLEEAYALRASAVEKANEG